MSVRSAVTARRVGSSSSAAAARASSVQSSPARASTARAPWAGAGSIVSRSRTSLAQCSRPRRRSPDRARTTASRSPAASARLGATGSSVPTPTTSSPRTRARRVGTLPRRSTTSRSGRAASSWAARRGEPVPTRAPSGRSARVRPSRAHRASRGSSRAGTQMTSSPSTGCVGRSLKEWTTRSTSPSRSAWRSRAAKTPTPPSCRRGVRSPSPSVRTVTRSMPRPPEPSLALPAAAAAPPPPAAISASATCPDWVSARREPRVPSRSRRESVPVVVMRPLLVRGSPLACSYRRARLRTLEVRTRDLIYERAAHPRPGAALHPPWEPIRRPAAARACSTTAAIPVPATHAPVTSSPVTGASCSSRRLVRSR